ncbi:DNA double-strand break repair Rad50 ATPase [Entamoeba marina]
MRLKEDAQRILEVQAEQMRQRRRFIRDMYEAKEQRESTRNALDKVKDVELNKTIKAIEKSGNVSLDLRNQNRAIEMKERAYKLKQDRLAEVLRRKMLIVQEQIKTAKIQRNEELRNKLSETKNDYLSKIKAQLADEIDELKKDKTVFESERTIAHKKIDNELKIEAHRLKAAQHAQKRKNYAHEINRKEMAKMRKAVAKAEVEQMERKATKSILNSKMKLIEKTTNRITAMKAEVANRKSILNTIATGVRNMTETEKKQVEDLKNKAVKAKQQRQLYKTQIARDILVDAHNRHLSELKEKKAEIDAAINSTIADRNRKSALKMNKAKSMISLAGLQGKLDKKYILKRQQVALKNSKAFSDAVKRLLPKKQEQRLKIKSFKPKCGKLSKKMSTPCSMTRSCNKGKVTKPKSK